MYLAAAGVGQLGIVDFDLVEESNLQRQVLFGTSDLGNNKALTAKKRLSDLNNTLTIDAFPYRLTYQNALALFKSYDIVVDGSDNYPTRYLINDAALICGKPVIYGAIFKFEGQVSVFNYQKGPSYRCLFENPPKAALANCSEIGVLGVLPGIIGSMMANEVLKIILELGNVLSGRVLLYESLTSKITTIEITRKEEIIKEVLQGKETFQEQFNDPFCGTAPLEVSVLEILQQEVQLVDVRNLDELPKVTSMEVTRIPLHELENRINELNPEKKIVLFCATGRRSLMAVSLLQGKNFMNCASLRGGAQELLNHQKNIVHENT